MVSLLTDIANKYSYSLLVSLLTDIANKYSYSLLVSLLTDIANKYSYSLLVSLLTDIANKYSYSLLVSLLTDIADKYSYSLLVSLLTDIANKYSYSLLVSLLKAIANKYSYSLLVSLLTDDVKLNSLFNFLARVKCIVASESSGVSNDKGGNLESANSGAGTRNIIVLSSRTSLVIPCCVLPLYINTIVSSNSTGYCQRISNLLHHVCLRCSHV